MPLPPQPTVRTTDAGEAEYAVPAGPDAPSAPASSAQITRTETGFTVVTDTDPKPYPCASFDELTAFLGQTFGQDAAVAAPPAGPPPTGLA